jgi:hypothetical protein
MPVNDCCVCEYMGVRWMSGMGALGAPSKYNFSQLFYVFFLFWFRIYFRRTIADASQIRYKYISVPQSTVICLCVVLLCLSVEQ